jgi:hypothetical protein
MPERRLIQKRTPPVGAYLESILLSFRSEIGPAEFFNTIDPLRTNGALFMIVAPDGTDQGARHDSSPLGEARHLRLDDLTAGGIRSVGEQ